MSTQEIRIGGTMHEAARADTSRAALLAALAAARFRVRQRLTEYIRQRAFRQAEKELMALDERMLRDIGLSRSEIGSAVHP